MSRSSDIVHQIQHRRAERKKPKINAKLKTVSIDENQKGGITAAQENKPPPLTVQKTGGRNSLALTFSVGLHVSLALLLGFFYIKQQIASEVEDLAVALVPQEPPLTERSTIKPRPRVTFDAKPQEIDVPVQRTPVRNPNIRRTPGDFELPSPSDTDLAPAGPGLDTGLKIKAIPGGLKGPVQPTQPVVKPTFDRPTQETTSIADLDTAKPSEGPSLLIPEIDTTQAGVTPPKTKISRKPEYPKNARRAEKEGTVILLATITKDGVAKNIRKLTNLGFGFEEAAIAALKRFKFMPAKKNGVEIEFDVKIPFEFKLEDK